MKSDLPESPTLRSDLGTPERTLRALAQASSQLGHAVGEVLSGALGSRKARRPGNAGESSAEKSSNRLREVLERDRALIASLPDFDELHTSTPAPVVAREQKPRSKVVVPPPPPPSRREAIASVHDEPTRVGPLPAGVVEKLDRLEQAERSAKTERSAEQAADRRLVAQPLESSPRHGEPPLPREPIRTRTMAILLASQGHRRRALSIYEELLAKEPEDAILRAEVEALRAQND